MKDEVIVFKSPTHGRLDKLLHQLCSEDERLVGITRSQIKLWIEAGQVSVNRKVVLKAGTLVKALSDLTLVYHCPSQLEHEPYEFNLNIVYEDDDVLVLDKPAGISVHPGAGEKRKTLYNALLHYLQKQISTKQVKFLREKRAGIVHRLDKDTTGLLLIAKNLITLNKLTQQFKQRTIRRTYLALVLSHPRGGNTIHKSSSGIIEGNIGRNPKSRKEMCVLKSGGRSAVTHWNVMQRLTHAALLRLNLETGRTHQIRVHLNHIGAPVIGDVTYGNFSTLPADLRKAANTFGRQALHAAALEFIHPTTGKLIKFESELPGDFKKLLETFRQYEL